MKKKIYAGWLAELIECKDYFYVKEEYHSTM